MGSEPLVVLEIWKGSDSVFPRGYSNPVGFC